LLLVLCDISHLCIAIQQLYASCTHAPTHTHKSSPPILGTINWIGILHTYVWHILLYSQGNRTPLRRRSRTHRPLRSTPQHRKRRTHRQGGNETLRTLGRIPILRLEGSPRRHYRSSTQELGATDRDETSGGVVERGRIEEVPGNQYGQSRGKSKVSQEEPAGDVVVGR